MLKITSHQLNVEMEVPNEEKLVNVDVNLREGSIQLYYEGWGTPLVVENSADAMSVTYDGELDDPDHPIPRQSGGFDPNERVMRPRPVKDSPQA